MTVQLPPDHRLKSPSTYNREDVIAAITEFYQFLTTLVFYEPTDVLYPPPEGWPQIREKLAPWHKSDEVIELLRHLPYLDSRPGIRDIIPWSHPCDYINRPLKYNHPVMEFPPWVINLTSSSKVGVNLMLDTSDGTVTEYRTDGFEPEPPFYAKNDPRHWRNDCEDQTMPLREYLEKCKNRYLNLHWIPPVSRWRIEENLHLWDEVSGGDSPDAEAIRDTYLAHGWPDSFDREACKRVLFQLYDAK